MEIIEEESFRMQEHLDGALAEDSVPFGQLVVVADAAAACLQPEASARPTMSSIVAFLQDLVPSHPPQQASQTGEPGFPIHHEVFCPSPSSAQIRSGSRVP